MPNIAEKIEAKQALEAAESAAASLPLPGPAGDAFLSGPISVGKWTVRKIVKYDWRVWQMTDNAIVKALASLGQDNAKVEYDQHSEAVAVWMLIHTPEEVYEAVKAGVEKFKERCVRELEMTDDIDTEDFRMLFEQVMEQVRRSCLTMLKHQTKSDDEKKITTLPIKDVLPMASVG